MFGVRNGIVYPAFCGSCRRPWVHCRRTCDSQATPINNQGRPLTRLLNPQNGAAAWRYCGQPTAVFCSGCGAPYTTACCGGFFGPMDAFGNILQGADLGEFLGSSVVITVTRNGQLQRCGLCYGMCICTSTTPTLLNTLLIAAVINDANPIALDAAQHEGQSGSTDGQQADCSAGQADQGQTDQGGGDTSSCGPQVDQSNVLDHTSCAPAATDPSPSYDPGPSTDFGGGFSGVGF